MSHPCREYLSMGANFHVNWFHGFAWTTMINHWIENISFYARLLKKELTVLRVFVENCLNSFFEKLRKIILFFESVGELGAIYTLE
jgi:hypothetical protein